MNVSNLSLDNNNFTQNLIFRQKDKEKLKENERRNLLWERIIIKPDHIIFLHFTIQAFMCTFMCVSACELVM